MNTLSPIVDRCHHSAFNQFTYILNLKHMKHPFLPQITNVEILDYPILAGSGNIGIKADVLGEKKMKTIGLIEENFWRQTPTENKELAVVCIAARTFRLDLLRHFNMDHKKVQTASELMYHHWDSTGRKEEGYRTEMLVNDNRYFPDNEETEIEFDIHDGFAVGEHEGQEYVMFYPTALEVYMSDSMQHKIRDYVGQAVTDTGIIPADIALTYGKVKMIQPAPQQVQAAETKEKIKAIHQNTSLQAVSDIRIRKGMDGNTYISCLINGEKQLAKHMKPGDVEYYQMRMAASDKAFNGVASELVQKYYAKEIADAHLDREQSQGMKR